MTTAGGSQTSAKLDFRDIHQHPPDAAFATACNDPSWDTHRVLFNERPREKEVHGDEFDGIFEVAEHEKKLDFGTIEDDHPQDESLDPLGWPVQPAAFRTMAPAVTSAVSPSKAFPEAPFYDDDDIEDDDLNLLRRRQSDDEESVGGVLLPAVGRSAYHVSGIETAYRPAGATSAVVGYRVKDRGPSKQTRIEQYTTTGVDDESSVEEEGDGEDWNADRNVDYLAQSEDAEDDEDALPGNSGFANFEAADVAPAELDIQALQEARKATEQMAQLVVDSQKKQAAKAAASSKKKSTSGVVPLLRPPPAEKLAQWEASMGASLFPKDK